MDDDLIFDILNDHHPGDQKGHRKEVLWDLVVVYDDGQITENIDKESHRIAGTFFCSGERASFITGKGRTMDFVHSVKHTRRGVVIKGHEARDEANDTGVSGSRMLGVTWYLVPRQLRPI